MKKRKNDGARKRRAKAWGITIAIHLVLLFVFLIWKYDLPNFYFEEEPIEIALGTDMDGFGDDPDQVMDAPAQEVAQTAQDRGASSSQHHLDASDDDVPNPVKVQKTNPDIKSNRRDNNKPVATPNTQTTNSRSTQQSAPKQTGRYVMNNSSGQGGNSAAEDKKGTGSGNTTGTGTSGSPGGSPTGRMTAAANLRDRVIERAPNPQATYNQGGQVTIRVTVNREGIITKAVVRSSSNATIRRIAEQKVKEIKFNASPTALPEQSGDIIFRF